MRFNLEVSASRSPYNIGNTDSDAHLSATCSGERFGLVGTGMDSMEIRRIEAGIVSNGNDMTPTMNPFQAGLGKFVDMSKADFIGKAALEEADRRLLLYGVQCDKAAPRGSVVLDGAPIGRVTAAAWSPFWSTVSAMPPCWNRAIGWASQRYSQLPGALVHGS